MQQLTQYVSAMRHLRATQVQGRLWMLIQRKGLHRSEHYRAWYLRRATGHEAVTPLPPLRGKDYPDNALDVNRVDELAANRFTFLNHSIDLGTPINWFPSGETQLWHYNLHYFHYAITLANAYEQCGYIDAYQIFRRLVHEWSQSCPVATPVAWDAYPTSLRLTNWIKAYTLFEPLLRNDEAFATQLRRSIFVQASFLETHVEYHLLGNHLIENGRALLLAGLFFTDPNTLHTATRWQAKGQQILWDELSEQFLPDGGHYERSPMYHHLYLNLYQEVIALLQAKGLTVPALAHQRMAAMTDWLGSVVHPDGNIPLLNDAAFGMVNKVPALFAEQITPCNGLKALANSGYFVFRNKQAQDFLIFDCAPLGPDYFPSHGHCDALSYELSLAGQRMIVDSGVGNYDGDLMARLYYRSTRAHNTVVVDSAEQSEIWDRYRVGRRAYPLDVQWGECATQLAYVVGAHSGYRRLRGKVIHRRWLCWVDRRFWLVCDSITGQGEHQIESFIHFHPDVTVVRTPGPAGQQPSGEVCNAATTLQILPWGAQSVKTYHGEGDPIQGWMAPDFGLEQKNVVWGLACKAQLPLWFGYVLWPGKEAFTLDFDLSNEGRCQINLKTVDRSYGMVFNDTANTRDYTPKLAGLHTEIGLQN